MPRSLGRGNRSRRSDRTAENAGDELVENQVRFKLSGDEPDVGFEAGLESGLEFGHRKSI